MLEKLVEQYSTVLENNKYRGKLKKQKKDIYEKYYEYKKGFIDLSYNNVNYVLLEMFLEDMSSCMVNLTLINCKMAESIDKGYIKCNNSVESSMYKYCDAIADYSFSELDKQILAEKTSGICKLAMLLSMYKNDEADDEVIKHMMNSIIQKVGMCNVLLGDEIKVDESIYKECVKVLNPEKKKVRQYEV